MDEDVRGWGIEGGKKAQTLKTRGLACGASDRVVGILVPVSNSRLEQCTILGMADNDDGAVSIPRPEGPSRTGDGCLAGNVTVLLRTSSVAHSRASTSGQNDDAKVRLRL